MMLMKNKKYLFTILVLLLFLCGFQTLQDPLGKLKSLLLQYNALYPDEKVYLQLDKPFYKPGDDIWFNAFVVNGQTLKPSAVSDVVYVELIDPKGNVSLRRELLLTEGTAAGDFKLEQAAPGGQYRIQAYTLWMKNYGQANVFKKDVPVQRVITPRLLLKLDFEKEAYGTGDSVHAKLIVRDLNNELIAGAALKYTAMLAGNYLTDGQTLTNRSGQADVSFLLPATLTTTDGLLNIAVGAQGESESISRSIPIVLNNITLQFFPEGGQCIEGVSARMAFKALNEFGKGADVAGTIVDASNTAVARFESYHMGMGAFDFTPEAGKKYFARIERPAGSHDRIPLPDAVTSGFSLHLEKRDAGGLTWTIHAPRKQPAYLVGQAHGTLYYAEAVDLVAGRNTLQVPTGKFPAGIGVFTVLDAQGMEQCERLVFMNSHKQLNLRITTDKKRYMPREKVEARIEATDENDKPVRAKVAVAVTDDQLIAFADDKQDNILSSFLLSSEVQGEIQEPSFYFDPQEPKASQALDYLLMTQGWRRFTWKEIRKPTLSITQAPEKLNIISGTVVNAEGAGRTAEVTLLEAGSRRRIAKATTTADGHFVFRNVDPAVPVLLVTRKPGEIILQKRPSSSFTIRGNYNAIPVADATGVVEEETVALNPGADANDAAPMKVKADGSMDLSLEADVAALEEVVVTGYGLTRRDVTGAVFNVNSSTLGGQLPYTNPLTILQGRVAGLEVTLGNANAGGAPHIQIRGSNSLRSGSNEPLYIIDGHPISSSLNNVFSNGTLLGPEDIASIEVLTSADATALYGSRAANGVIMITTRKNIAYPHFKTKPRKQRYSGVTVQARNFSAVREFYVAPPAKSKTRLREDFRTTLYWNGTVVTDERGQAAFSFYNNDAVSAFRITTEGLTGTGLIGRTEHVYSTGLPFSLDARLPEYLGYEDVLHLPVKVKNETAETLTGELSITLPAQGLKLEGPTTRIVQVPPSSSETFWLTLTPTGVAGNFPIAIQLTTPDLKDEIKHTVSVHPVGFPASFSFSGKTLDKSLEIDLSDAERGTVKADVTAFPDVLSDLFTGAESILREPHGCFEQVSSSTFPNILALQFMRESGQLDADIEKRALSLIKDGYKQLMAYEIKGGGFEWFGHPPAHEGLTAFGLLEFYEMQKVWPGVDVDVLDRTTQWLLSRRNGKGGFVQNSGKYGFSGASVAVTNAYLTYALAETGTHSVTEEYNLASLEARNSGDMYRQALMANAALALDKQGDYLSLVRNFKAHVTEDGFERLKIDHSIVRSYGKSLQVETVALWTVALLKATTVDADLVQRCMEFMLTNRYYGGFGSTQATTLALKALTAYAGYARKTASGGEIQVLVNNKLVESRVYAKDARGKMVLDQFTERLTRDARRLQVKFADTSEPLPYAVTVTWRTKTPQSSNVCKVRLNTTLSATRITTQQTVRLTATLTNTTAQGLPMTMAVIGLPAGLSAQPWQLKELQEKKAFDFYEIQNGNLVLYYREMAPNGTNTVHLDLKAEIPGNYTAQASSAYLYYTSEDKYWTKGSTIDIK
jgi:alpha-2-macroglobulin-like protein